MARKAKHEEHQNHEAWAIPYGDLVTLLLAFFVVMYSISSVNEGKYRVLSDSLSEAFGGPPKSPTPVQMGRYRPSGATTAPKPGEPPQKKSPATGTVDIRAKLAALGKIAVPHRSASDDQQRDALSSMADAVRKAMGPLIDRGMIVIRKNDSRLEIEIRTDILFASGAAIIGERARPILAKLAVILQPFPNALRIEGHTDNVPIHTGQFASNWELSAVRAASVVHLFMDNGIDPPRMSVLGFGEYRPATANDGPEARNRNRRVVLVVLAEPGQPVPLPLEATPQVSDQPVEAEPPHQTEGAPAPL